MMKFTRQRIVGFLSMIAMVGIILLVVDQLSVPQSQTQKPLINLSEFLTQLFVGLTLLCIAAAYWGFKPDVERGLQRLQHGSDLEWQRKQYDHHVKSLLKPLREKFEGQAMMGYYHLILNMKDFERKMLKQHLFTYSDESIQKSILYKIYMEIGSHNDAKEKIRRNILNQPSCGMQNDIRSLGFVSSNSEHWIQKLDFEQAIHFSVNDFLNNSPIKEVNYLNDIFDIKWEEDKKEWRLGTANNTFAGSKDKEKIEKLNEIIKSHALEINQFITEMNGDITIENASMILFQGDFRKIVSLVLDHGSTFAGCRKCLEYITDTKLQKEYKQMLDDQEKENRFSWS